LGGCSGDVQKYRAGAVKNRNFTNRTIGIWQQGYGILLALSGG